MILSTFSIFPRINPSPIAAEIVSNVNTKPSFPAATTAVKFIPNPRPITAPCKRYLVTVFDFLAKGLTAKIPITNPIKRDRDGDNCRKTINPIKTKNKVTIRLLGLSGIGVGSSAFMDGRKVVKKSVSAIKFAGSRQWKGIG